MRHKALGRPIITYKKHRTLAAQNRAKVEAFKRAKGPWIKVLDGRGYSTVVGKGWHEWLPRPGRRAGKWTPLVKAPVMCTRGWHLTKPVAAHLWLPCRSEGCVVLVCEPKPGTKARYGDGKAAFGSVRSLCVVPRRAVSAALKKYYEPGEEQLLRAENALGTSGTHLLNAARMELGTALGKACERALERYRKGQRAGGRRKKEGAQ